MRYDYLVNERELKDLKKAKRKNFIVDWVFISIFFVVGFMVGYWVK